MDRFKLMETYIAVVKLRSYTRAAKELGVTRAMVSKRIQDLEAALNARLLHRNTHRLSVTTTGADYYESCVAMLADLHALEERIQARRATPRGDIHILSTRTFGEMMLGPIVAEFSDLYPNIAIHVTLMDREMAPDGMDLVAGGFDLAIRTQPVGESSLIARPLLALPRILVAAPHYLARAGTPRTPAELSRHNCLDPSGAVHFTWEFLRPHTRSNIVVSGAPRANSSALVKQAALKGLGIAMLREYLVRDNLKDGSLVRVLADYEIDERKLFIVYQKDRYQPMRIRIFIKHLFSRLKEFSSEKAEARTRATVVEERR
jgi:DNA-binding transcriptional LysR family regulator